MLKTATRIAKEWLAAQKEPANTTKTVAITSPVRTPSTMICYTDAAWRPETGEAGLGWIVRDQANNIVIQGRSFTDQVSSVLMAEALADREALNLRNLSFASDCSNLIALINKK
ncbi:hypothetical protein AALP_AA3G309000 [Arabis alpina]|uniref:RNase H type-1 domain-containing protein n=1 Tax=Arabis alpina TaxID=50452 RepID=A0A087HCT2_ARAAL|nr:hypothetical protein AALP_AA3G309000 [Arabis alpina]